MPEASANRSGFQGAIENLPLVDLLQVWAMNGFSGLVTVSSQGHSGHLYFVEGGIVHAETEGVTGEGAVQRILSWPEGSFDLAPNTTTLHRTIAKSLSHLLLDAHRELDEQRRAPPAPPPDASAKPVSRTPPSPAAAPAVPPRSPLFDHIRAIPGVTGVVRFSNDGRPAGDGSPGAEALAATGLYVAMTHASAIADAFGLHDLSVASVASPTGPFVLLHSRGQYLCVSVASDVALEPLVAQLRQLLARPAARKP